MGNKVKQEDITSLSVKIKNDAIKKLFDYCFERKENLKKYYHTDEETLKDIIQEAIITTFYNCKTGKFRKESSLETYTFGICKNLCLSNKKTLINYSSVKEERLRAENEDSSLVSNKRIKELLDKLNSVCSDLLTKYYFNGASLEDISEYYHLGSIQAAKNKKHRCMKKLMLIVSQYKLEYDSFLA